MSGASATILFPTTQGSVLPAWRQLVDGRASAVEGEDFWVSSPSEADLQALPFFWHVMRPTTPEWELEDEEMRAISADFGWVPELGILIGACCRGLASDTILGELAMAVLGEHEGALQFHGMLSPTLEREGWRSWHEMPEAARAAMFPEAIGPHTGKVSTVWLEGEPAYHVVDRTFLSFWMGHPAFHFVN